jgi:hypothetical protein
MTPSSGRWVWAAMVTGALVWAADAGAQQSGSGQQTAPAKAQNAQGTAKSEATKRKAVEKKPKADPTAAQGEVENGVNALAQGRPDAAITSLSNALAAGSLPQQQTARALYYRGVAYRRAAKPAQAISDLTSSLWIKNGLTDEQRADAAAQRSAAYRDAGLPDQAEPPAQRTATRSGSAKEPQNATPFSGVAPAAPASSTSLTGSGTNFFNALFGGGATSQSVNAPNATASSAPANPARATQAVPAQPAPTTTASVAPRSTSSPPPAPAATSGPTASSGTSPADGKPPTRLVPIHGRTSSLPTGFQEFPEPVRYVEVNTQAPARAAQPDTPPPSSASAPSGRAVSDPRSGPGSTAGRAAQSPRTEASPPAGTRSGSAAGGAAPAGPVRVQLAAVRSAAEAQTVAATVQRKYARELGGRAPVVDQLSAGSLGTIWRVQVGPFASARESDPLCARLKGEGLECRVVGSR